MSKKNSPSGRARKERRAKARLDLVATTPTPVRIEESGKNTNNCDRGKTPEHQKLTPPQGTFGKILTAGGGVLSFALWLWSVTFNGFFNFFSAQPAVQLLPFAVVLCVVIFAVLHKFTGGYAQNKIWYIGAAIVCVGVIAITVRLVYARTVSSSSSNLQPTIRTNIVWEPPELPAGCEDVGIVVESKNFHNVSAGSVMSNVTNKWFNLIAMEWGQIRCCVTNNRYYISAELPAPSGKTIKVDGNKVGPVPWGWDWNTNSFAIEIVDDEKKPMYQMFYLHPYSVKLIAAYQLPAVKAFFRYPGVWHPGERADQ